MVYLLSIGSYLINVKDHRDMNHRLVTKTPNYLIKRYMNSVAVNNSYIVALVLTPL